LASGTLATSAVAKAGSTPAHLIGAVPGIDPPIEVEDLHAQLLELMAKGLHTLPGQVRDAVVIGVGEALKQFLDAAAAHHRDNAELGQMRADGIDHRGLLADEQMSGPVQHQARLLVGRFHRHEAHARIDEHK